MTQLSTAWLEQVEIAFTQCDADGVIEYMNNRSAATFAEDGGLELVGKNLSGCHPEAARQKLAELLSAPALNVYTIEKKGRRKMIYQAPLFEAGQFKGIVEISLPLPEEIPHFIRK
jgi:chloramphenicol O-acetyltransferase